MGIILTKASTMRIEKKKEEFQNKLENTVPACLMGAGMGVALVTLKNQPVRDKFVKIIDKTAKGTGKGIAKLFPKMEPALKKNRQKICRTSRLGKSRWGNNSNRHVSCKTSSR